jgi:hypothetical protein
MRKKPSTSELLDWLMVLVRAGVGPEDLARKLPFMGILVKQEQDISMLKSRNIGMA